VGRFISLERLVDESRDGYYEALRNSSEGWHEGKHDLIPWINYFLSVLRRAYREFEQRADQVKPPRGAKIVLVETAIDAFVAEFTLGELERACPGVSRDMVRRVLRQLQKKGRVACLARGPSAHWRRKGTTLKKGQ
jgi:Fic family protein